MRFPPFASLSLALLTTLSSACAPTMRLAEPPSDLLDDCAPPTLARNPVVDLPAYERALQLCNEDKAALRTWRDGIREARKT